MGWAADFGSSQATGRQAVAPGHADSRRGLRCVRADLHGFGVTTARLRRRLRQSCAASRQPGLQRAPPARHTLSAGLEHRLRLVTCAVPGAPSTNAGGRHGESDRATRRAPQSGDRNVRCDGTARRRDQAPRRPPSPCARPPQRPRPVTFAPANDHAGAPPASLACSTPSTPRAGSQRRLPPAAAAVR